MKKNRCLAFFAFSIIITLLLCSCSILNKPYTESENYDTTVDFFTHPDGNGKYDGWRFLYNRDGNKVVRTTKQNVKMGASRTIYFDSPNAEKILSFAQDNQLGQFNDYLCFDGIELVLYWDWAGQNSQNTLIAVQNDNIQLYNLPDGGGDALNFMYYNSDSNTVYIADFFEWNSTITECSGNFFAVNLNTQEINTNNISVYNEQLEKQYDIMSKIDYPISQWGYKEDTVPAIAVIPDGEKLMMCISFSPYVPEIKTYSFFNLLISYNLKTDSIENLKVINELMCHLQRKDDGYITMSRLNSLTGIAATSFVQRMWMSEYDKSFNLIKTTEIDCEEFKNCNSIKVCGSGKEAFIKGDNMNKNTNVLGLYNMETGKLIMAENVPDGFISDMRLIQKTGGKIYNIQR